MNGLPDPVLAGPPLPAAAIAAVPSFFAAANSPPGTRPPKVSRHVRAESTTARRGVRTLPAAREAPGWRGAPPRGPVGGPDGHLALAHSHRRADAGREHAPADGARAQGA